MIFYDSPVPVHTGSRLTDPGYSVPGEVHGFPAIRNITQEETQKLATGVNDGKKKLSIRKKN